MPLCSIRVTKRDIQRDAYLFCIHQHCASLSDDDYTSLSCLNVSWSYPGGRKLSQLTATQTPGTPHATLSSIDTLHLKLQQPAADIYQQAGDLKQVHDTFGKVTLTNTALVAENVQLRVKENSLRNEAQAIKFLGAHSATKSGELESLLQDTSWKRCSNA